MKRSPLGRGKGLHDRSAKAKAKVPQRRAVLDEVRRRDRTCRARLLVPAVACCTWAGLEVHEIKARSAGGDAYDAEGCILLCACHHAWIDLHSDEAKALGLKRSSWEPTKGQP